MRLQLKEFYTGKNFGTIQIDWTATPPRVSLQIRGLIGQVVLEHSIELTEVTTGSKQSQDGPKQLCDLTDSPSLVYLIPFDWYKYLVYAIALSIVLVILSIVICAIKAIRRTVHNPKHIDTQNGKASRPKPKQH